MTPPLPCRALLGVAAAIAAAVPVLFGAYVLTAVGGPELLTWMATWGTPIGYAACTAIILTRFPVALTLGLASAARPRSARNRCDEFRILRGSG